MAAVGAIPGLIGARLFCLAQTDAGGLAAPSRQGSTGFAFYGTVIAAVPAIALYLRVSGRPVLEHLDVLALAFPVSMALLAVVLLAVHQRLRRPGHALWLVLGVYSLGRLVVFTWVSDVEVVALGLRQAQWTSVALVVVAITGATTTTRFLDPRTGTRRGSGLDES